MSRLMSEALRTLFPLAIVALAACGDDPTGVGDRTGGPDGPVVVGLYTFNDTIPSGDTISITEFSLDEWLVPEGDQTWRVEDGALIGEGQVSQMALLHGTLQSGASTWVEVDVDRADDGGIVLRAQDEDSYYLVAIRDDSTAVGFSGADSNVELYRFVDGEWESFADYGGVDVDWPRGQMATIRIWAIDDVIMIFFNGELVNSGNDPSFANGSIGVRTNAFFHTQMLPSLVRYRALRWGTF